jgi:hypothetical protein
VTFHSVEILYLRLLRKFTFPDSVTIMLKHRVNKSFFKPSTPKLFRRLSQRSKKSKKTNQKSGGRFKGKSLTLDRKNMSNLQNNSEVRRQSVGGRSTEYGDGGVKGGINEPEREEQKQLFRLV